MPDNSMVDDRPLYERDPDAWQAYLAEGNAKQTRKERQVQRMSSTRAALVVIDMQNGFINDRSRHIIPKVVELVERWEATGRPVVFTRYHNYPGSPFERLIDWSAVQHPPETDIVPELQPHAARARAVVDKRIYSYFNSEGADLTAQEDWTDLVFCGVATESCVLKSAVDAFERDLTPWLVTDALGEPRGSRRPRRRPTGCPPLHRRTTAHQGQWVERGRLVTSQSASFPGRRSLPYDSQ